MEMESREMTNNSSFLLRLILPVLADLLHKDHLEALIRNAPVIPANPIENFNHPVALIRILVSEGLEPGREGKTVA